MRALLLVAILMGTLASSQAEARPAVVGPVQTEVTVLNHLYANLTWTVEIHHAQQYTKCRVRVAFIDPHGAVVRTSWVDVFIGPDGSATARDVDMLHQEQARRITRDHIEARCD